MARKIYSTTSFARSAMTYSETHVNARSAVMSFARYVLRDGNGKATIYRHNNFYVLYGARASSL